MTVILSLEIFTKTYTDIHRFGIIYSSFHLFTARPKLLFIYFFYLILVFCIGLRLSTCY